MTNILNHIADFVKQYQVWIIIYMVSIFISFEIINTVIDEGKMDNLHKDPHVTRMSKKILRVMVFMPGINSIYAIIIVIAWLGGVFKLINKKR